MNRTEYDVTVLSATRRGSRGLIEDLLKAVAEGLAEEDHEERDTPEEIGKYTEQNAKAVATLKEWARASATHETEGCYGCEVAKDPHCPGEKLLRRLQLVDREKAAAVSMRLLGEMLVAADVNQMVDEAHTEETAAAE